MGMTAQDKLESIVHAQGGQEVLSEFRRYHVSVLQKLWSADHYCSSIAQLSLNPAIFYEGLTTATAAGTTDDREVVAQGSTYKWFVMSANMFLDGFLMNSMAALDTLAHEVWVVYIESKRPGDLYISTIAQSRERSEDGIQEAGLLTTWRENWQRNGLAY